MKTYWIETWGCQMNVLDSEYLAGMLQVLAWLRWRTLKKRTWSF
jgi:tRNA A37 methylthiotransferase MiaB